MPEIQVTGPAGMLNGGGEFTTMRADVLWVYKQYRNCVRRTENRTLVDLNNASAPPPSEGAVALLEWAAENRHEFFASVVHKYLSKDEQGDEQAEVKEEKKSLVELRRLAESLRRECEQELRK